MTTLPRCMLCSPPERYAAGTMLQIHCHHMEMRHVNWRAFDLNLLVVFDGLMQERSVTRAGRRLGMSQPALSHALNRLRYLLKDQLFIRSERHGADAARGAVGAPSAPGARGHGARARAGGIRSGR